MNDRTNPNDDRGPTGFNGGPLPPDDLDSLRGWMEERSFDALLVEALAGAEPPDLTKPILERLARGAVSLPDPTPAPLTDTPARTVNLAPPPVVCPSHAHPQSDRIAPHTARKLSVVAAIVATVAATLLAITWLRQPEADNAETRLADGQTDSPNAPSPESGLATTNDGGRSAGTPDPSPETPSPDAGGPRNAPVVLVPSTEPGEPTVAGRDPASIASTDDRTDAASAAPIRTVSVRFDADFRRYWDAVGVTPSDDRAAESVARLVSERLGMTLEEGDIGDVERIRSRIAKSENAEAIASRWLNRVTEGGFTQLDDSAKAGIVQELASAFRGARRFDTVLEGWLSGKSEHASDWYQAVTRGGSPATVRRLASLTMDVDLRCTRCHDSQVDRDGLQQDYWAFAAMFRRDVDRRDDGSYVVLADDADHDDVFYDLPDGRRRLAEPGIPSRWLDLEAASGESAIDGETPVTVREWAAALRGSEPLARGVVNSLWELVHGRPLDASVIDPLTAPRDATLKQLEAELAGDLVASGFDISRTLALILRSPVTARSILDESSQDSLFATSEQTRRAVAAFAAGTPSRSPLAMNRKLDIALRSIGGKISTLGDGEKVLAQVGDQANRNRGGKGNRTEFQIPTDFPVRADSPPVNWLDDLDDWDEKLDHLAYLSGRTQLPDEVRETAKGMREAELDDELILHRVWWLLQR